jgi:hypothetical protein
MKLDVLHTWYIENFLVTTSLENNFIVIEFEPQEPDNTFEGLLEDINFKLLQLLDFNIFGFRITITHSTSAGWSNSDADSNIVLTVSDFKPPTVQDPTLEQVVERMVAYCDDYAAYLHHDYYFKSIKFETFKSI